MYILHFIIHKALKLFKMSFQTENTDEFGRDLSLRCQTTKNQQSARDFIAEISLTLEEEKDQKTPEYASDCIIDLYRKFAGMSWAEITFAIEEEEEEEREKNKEKNKKQDERRRYLFTIGEYELEEGEVFE